MADTKHPLPAHRPSRRAEIVDAAIRLFARKGFVDASIGDVAEEADVVVTAVYYHFSGKEELFSAAVRRVFDMIDETVAGVRSDDAPGDVHSLDRIIDAVWEWVDSHPDEAALIHLQLPGVTRQTVTLRQDFENLHVSRSFVYFAQADRSDRSGRRRTPAARRSAETLAARTLVDMLMAVHPMRLADGPISEESNASLRQAVHRISQRIVALD